MRNKIEQLRQKILQIAELAAPSAPSIVNVPDLENRPVFLMAPLSYAGMVHGERIASSLSNVIASVDDQSQQPSIHGAPRWSSSQFLDNIHQYPNALAIDFSCSARGRLFFEQLCQTAGIERLALEKPEVPLINELETRPLFLMAPTSFIAGMHAQSIVTQSKQVVAAIDDNSTLDTIHGAPRWSSRQFIEKAHEYPDALALDFSSTPHESSLVEKLCELSGIEQKTAILAAAQYGLAAVYEPARVYRLRTLSRLDDFLRLAERLDDDFSVFTLYSNLLFRLTYDPSYLRAAWATPSNEYFSACGDTSTFEVGQREHFCDCGAYQGPVVRKFLEASHYKYESITAFEPDSANYQKLQAMASPHIPNFRAVRKAVSNTNEPLRFKETGTMSSHATADGNITVPSARLDDELEKLTLLKMDIEGFEAKALEGASRLIRTQRPRIAVCVYHYALDLLDVVDQLDKLVEGYHLRLRQHSSAYYYDLVLYASPVAGASAPSWAR